jgi:hypothetical protein
VRASGQILVDILTSDRRKEMDEVLGQSIFDIIVVFIVVDRSERRGRQSRWEMNFANRADESYDLDAISNLEIFFSDGTCSDATCTLPR